MLAGRLRNPCSMPGREDLADVDTGGGELAGEHLP